VATVAEYAEQLERCRRREALTEAATRLPPPSGAGKDPGARKAAVAAKALADAEKKANAATAAEEKAKAKATKAAAAEAKANAAAAAAAPKKAVKRAREADEGAENPYARAFAKKK